MILRKRILYGPPFPAHVEKLHMIIILLDAKSSVTVIYADASSTKLKAEGKTKVLQTGHGLMV